MSTVEDIAWLNNVPLLGSAERRPNGLALSRAALIDRDDNRAEIGFQNAPDLVAACDVGSSARLGRICLSSSLAAQM